MQDIATDELAAICGACHEISQQAAPLLVVGAGLPHLPVALAASKSYAERLFRYVVVDRLCRRPSADRALRVPADEEGVDFDDDALDRAAAADRRLPLLRAGLRQGHLGRRDRARPITRDDVLAAAPEAEAELAVGFFGVRYERATPAERDYMTAMADLGADGGDAADRPPPTWRGTSAASRSRSRPPATA